MLPPFKQAARFIIVSSISCFRYISDEKEQAAAAKDCGLKDAIEVFKR
jgi:hypothetical protein